MAAQRAVIASERLFRRPFALAVASAAARASASEGRSRRPTTTPPLPGRSSPDGVRYQTQIEKVGVPSYVASATRMVSRLLLSISAMMISGVESSVTRRLSIRGRSPPRLRFAARIEHVGRDRARRVFPRGFRWRARRAEAFFQEGRISGSS